MADETPTLTERIAELDADLARSNTGTVRQMELMALLGCLFVHQTIMFHFVVGVRGPESDDAVALNDKRMATATRIQELQAERGW